MSEYSKHVGVRSSFGIVTRMGMDARGDGEWHVYS